MAVQILDIKNEYNQKITTAVEIEEEIKNLEIFLEFNKMAGYWVCSIKDLAKDEMVISSMPLLVGQDLLTQYEYLGIGSSVILNMSDKNPDDFDDTNLGTDFLWAWNNYVE
jgi:predicted Zn-dependent protease with MMP-like domain